MTHFGGFGSLRPGERVPAAAMALSIGSVMMAYYFLKPVRDSLFLSEASPERLPLVYMLAVVVAAPAAALHASLGRRVALGPMAVGTLLVAAASLPLMWLLVGWNFSWVPYLLYSWAGIVGALCASQLWLLAGAVFDATEAKRVFPLLSVGAILGAFIGGETTRTLIDVGGLATRDLLLAAAVVLSLAAAVTRVVCVRWGLEHRDAGDRPRRRRSGREPRMSTRELSRLVMRSGYLRVFVGMVALAVVITTFVDYQFKTIAWEAHPDAAGLTAFLGRFYGVVSLLSLGVQLLLSGRILKHLGIAGLLGALPLVLLLGSAALIVAPGLLAASLLRGGDLGLRHSLDRTGRELLLMPVPLELKKRTKLFIDVFVDRWFRGLAGALLLLLTMVMGVSVRGLVAPVILLTVFWMFMVVLARRQYVDAFRAALRRRDIDPKEITRGIGDDTALAALSASLRSGRKRQILYALSLATAAERLDHQALVVPLLEHESGSVRTAALQVLTEVGERGQVERVRAMMHDDDHHVRQAACGYLVAAVGDDRQEQFRLRIDDEDLRVRAAVGRWVADHGSDADMELVDKTSLDRLLVSDHVDCQRAAVRLLGRRADASALPRLLTMTSSPNSSVARDAAAAVVRLDGDDARERALELLSDRRLRAAVREALVIEGQGVVPDLVRMLENPGTGQLVRLQVIKALGKIGGADAAKALLALVGDPDMVIRESAMLALLPMRRRSSGFKISGTQSRALPLERLDAYYGLFQARHRLARTLDDDPASRLLLRTLDDRLEGELRACFMILALRHPFRDIRNAWLGVHSGQKHLKASAAEYLDQLLPSPLREGIRPLTEGWDDLEVWEAGRRHFGHALRNDQDAFRHLLERDDVWLRACATWCAARAKDAKLRALAVDRRDDLSPIVREAAAFSGT